VDDSQQESILLDGPHEQASSRPLPHDELVQLQRSAAQARLALIWVDEEMTWLAPREGLPGRPAVFSDAAIQFCLSIKVLFKLPLRQAAGMVASLLRLAGLDWSVPDFSTLCRRQKTLAVQIPYRRVDGPLKLLVDSTGIKFLGDGEWQARKHGVRGRRQWRKVHLAMDTTTSDIRAVEFTSNSDGGSPVLPDLLGQIPEDEQIGTVTAPSRDHASYDPAGQWTVPTTHAAAVPPSSIGGPRRSFRSERTAAPGRKTARRQRLATRRCLKAFGERIAARDPDRQAAEIHIRIARKNRFNALGTAEIVHVA
jgi:hypothetical protein